MESVFIFSILSGLVILVKSSRNCALHMFEIIFFSSVNTAQQMFTTKTLFFFGVFFFNENLCFFFPTGGVIAYISSSSTSSPEFCRSSSPNSSYLSTSPSLSRPSLPSRAIGMVVDIPPTTKGPQQRSHGMEKMGRSSSSNKSCITSKHNALLIKPTCSCGPEDLHFFPCFYRN